MKIIRWTEELVRVEFAKDERNAALEKVDAEGYGITRIGPKLDDKILGMAVPGVYELLAHRQVHSTTREDEV